MFHFEEISGNALRRICRSVTVLCRDYWVMHAVSSAWTLPSISSHSLPAGHSTEFQIRSVEFVVANKRPVEVYWVAGSYVIWQFLPHPITYIASHGRMSVWTYSERRNCGVFKRIARNLSGRTARKPSAVMPGPSAEIRAHKFPNTKEQS
jgi:hypothetical protein